MQRLSPGRARDHPVMEKFLINLSLSLSLSPSLSVTVSRFRVMTVTVTRIKFGSRGSGLCSES